MDTILKNKGLFLASILLCILIILPILFGLNTIKQIEVTYISSWYLIMFSGLILVTSILLYNEGIKSGKTEGKIELRTEMIKKNDK
jgi:uncharacterized membrane protein (DUF441 family)